MLKWNNYTSGKHMVKPVDTDHYQIFDKENIYNVDSSLYEYFKIEKMSFTY